MTAVASAAPPRFRKVLHGLDLTLFTVCAILVVDQLAAGAAIGVQSIFWWVATLVLFFIPYGLITAELGSAYPQEGGIYAWVRRALGGRWAGRTAWLWWVNVAFWMPSVFILFAGILAEVIAPQMPLWTQILIALALTWLTVAVNVVTLDIGKWIPNVGAVFKVLIMLAIGAGGMVYAARNGVANSFDLSSMRPSWGVSLAFLPVILYNFLGFELMSGAAEEMRNPARDVPIAIARSGLLIAGFYLFATVGMLMALPVADIGLIAGLTDTFERLFGGAPGGDLIVYALVAMALYSLLANMVTWTLGANRSAAEAARLGDLPALFARRHPRYGTPTSAAVLSGIIATAVLLLYGALASSAEDLFWTTFAFSSVVFLLPYLLLFWAFVRLRRSDAATPRPYRLPGGHVAAVAASLLCAAFVVQAIVFFVFPPQALDLGYSTAVAGGVAVTLIIGEFLVGGRVRAAGVDHA